MVKFELQGARSSSFQMPCRLAGCDPGRLQAISRYRPYWNSCSTSSGSVAPDFMMRWSVAMNGPVAGGAVAPGVSESVTRSNNPR